MLSLDLFVPRNKRYSDDGGGGQKVNNVVRLDEKLEALGSQP